LQRHSKTHKLNIEGEINIPVYADKTRLEQVLVNLISNAIKYSPGSNEVIIKVEKLPEGAKISVTDFGIGISKDKLPLIFDRFYRIDENSQNYAGLGLGLYVSSEIIKRHHSHINVESEMGKGSTFWFIIPEVNK
jgi:two-component system CheB/CheR fusion protein